MIEAKPYLILDNAVDRAHQAWKASLKKVNVDDCPLEVKQFIEAMDRQLDPFGQIGKFRTQITGYELLLSGMKELNGEPIQRWETYPLDVPRTVAVDHSTAMHRIYHRQGKQGLINYVRARVKGRALASVLEILTVVIFKQERPEFKAIMAQINESKPHE
jgi:hypothetical protein